MNRRQNGTCLIIAAKKGSEVKIGRGSHCGHWPELFSVLDPETCQISGSLDKNAEIFVLT